MATRTLLCVEPDAKDAEFIREALAPYGYTIKNLTNGDEAVDWGRKNSPSLIIVCVEPRKVGYAICNKLKRSDNLKEVPLILTSAEETKQTFDQHKKLRSHADEYILKPFTRHGLLTKIKNLVGLDGPEIGPENELPVEEISLSGDLEEISIGEQDIVEERAPVQAEVNGDTTGNIFGKRADLDSIFDQETEAAFAAIQSGEPDKTGPVDMETPVPPPTAPTAWDNDGWNDDAATHATSGLPPSFAMPPPPPVKPMFGLDGADVPPSPDEVMHPVASNDISIPISVAHVADERLAELQDRLSRLETEKHRLESENEDLKTRLQAQPLSKEKDILALREIINRKEKDVLDARDALDAKDRQILDHRDRAREHERARRDLEEKMLGFEKSLVAANERVTALSHDKEKSLERERGLKSRLDDALTEIQKAHEEVDGLKKRLQAAEERGRAEVERVSTELEGRIAELEENHRKEVGKAAEERLAAEAGRDREHQSEIARLEAARITEVETVKKALGDELVATTDRFQGEIAKLRRDHEKALASQKEEQTLQLAAERQAHQAAIEGKERDHRNEILGMRRRHEEELAAMEDRRQKELADAETRRLADLEAAETRRRAEMQTRDEEHHALVAEMDRRHFDEKTAMGERHRAEIDQAHARAARAEGELAARNEELAEAQRKVGAREADLDAVRADVRERDVKLGQTRDRVTELEAKSAELEEQILRAYQKLRSDEKTVDKAKRALAVALSLLDGSAAQAQAAQQAAGAASAGAAAQTARPTEESTT